MGEYDRKQRNQLSRAIANNNTGSKQLKGFVDNRMNFQSVTLQLYFKSNSVIQKHQEIKLPNKPFNYTLLGRGNHACWFDYNNSRPTSRMFLGTNAGHSEEKILANALGGPESAFTNPMQRDRESVVDAKKRVVTGYLRVRNGGHQIPKDLYSYYKPCNGNWDSNHDCHSLLNIALNGTVYYEV